VKRLAHEGWLYWKKQCRRIQYRGRDILDSNMIAHLPDDYYGGRIELLGFLDRQDIVS